MRGAIGSRPSRRLFHFRELPMKMPTRSSATFARHALVAILLVVNGLVAALPAAGFERGPARRGGPAADVVETQARVIVKFKADSALMRPLAASTSATATATSTSVLPQHAQALSARLGLSLTNGRMIGAREQVIKAKGMSSRELADRLGAQSDVEYAAVDGRRWAQAAPNDVL